MGDVRGEAAVFWEQVLSEIDDHGYFAVLGRRQRGARSMSGFVARTMPSHRQPRGFTPSGARSSGGDESDAWLAEAMVSPGSLRLSDLWLILLALSPLWLFVFAVVMLLTAGHH
jgi:hypothetical protein